jgi:hypothetical protein
MSDNPAGGSACAAPPADLCAGDPAQSVQVRVLPDGDPRPAAVLGWKGDSMRVDFGNRGFAPGAVLEIEAGPILYWGELRDRRDAGWWIKVEHSLDRSALASDRERWG